MYPLAKGQSLHIGAALSAMIILNDHHRAVMLKEQTSSGKRRPLRSSNVTLKTMIAKEHHTLTADLYGQFELPYF